MYRRLIAIVAISVCALACSRSSVNAQSLLSDDFNANTSANYAIVTLDGVPLTEGSITLLPLPGTSGPTAGGQISEGKFSISDDKGVFVGTFRVEITAGQKTGKKVMDPLVGLEMDEVVELIPERYNRQSELTVKVTETGSNKYEFALNTK